MVAMGTLTKLVELPTGAGSSPKALAVQSDNSHVFVTLNGLNELFVIDNTLPSPTYAAPVMSSPFALDATTDQPTGITVTLNGGVAQYAYIGKQGPGNQVASVAVPITMGSEAGTTVTLTCAATPAGLVAGDTVLVAGITGLGTAGYNGTFVLTGVTATTISYTSVAGLTTPIGAGGTFTPLTSQGIEVEDVTSVGTASTAGTISLKKDYLLTPGTVFNPDDVTVDVPSPNSTVVYVTLPGTMQFTALDNTMTPVPPFLGGAPFNLPDPTMAATDTPGGVSVPPSSTGTIFVDFSAMNMDRIDVLTQGTPPTATAKIAVTATSAPGRVRTLQIPQ